MTYDKVLYEAAKGKCQKDGGTLAMPKTKDVNDFLLQEMKRVRAKTAMWIGMNDKAEEGKYVWEDGTEVKSWDNMNYFNGFLSFDGEDCMALNPADKQWHDYKCSVTGFSATIWPLKNDKLPFICQYPILDAREGKDSIGQVVEPSKKKGQGDKGKDSQGQGDKGNDTQGQGDKDNDTQGQGDKDNDTHGKGDKDNDTQGQGDKDNDIQRQGDKGDDTQGQGDKDNDTQGQGDKDNDTHGKGDKDNDTQGQGDKDNDTHGKGDKDNDTHGKGDKGNDTQGQGDKGNDTQGQGDKDNDTHGKGDKDNDTHGKGDKDSDTHGQGDKLQVNDGCPSFNCPNLDCGMDGFKMSNGCQICACN